jgi:hypothetical protein
LIYAHRQRVTINKSDSNPTSIFFSSFENVTSRRKHPVNWLGVFFMPKKSHRWDTCRGSLAEVRVA